VQRLNKVVYKSTWKLSVLEQDSIGSYFHTVLCTIKCSGNNSIDNNKRHREKEDWLGSSRPEE
jgi:hypothetical protein